MLLVAELCLLATLNAATPIEPALEPQGRPAPSSAAGARPRNDSGAAPGAGTPEPATVLLLAGSALGYGAYRLGRRKPANVTPTDERTGS